MEKAGQSDVRRLSGLPETQIFGVAIQDSGSRLKRKTGWLGRGIGKGEGEGRGGGVEGFRSGKGGGGVWRGGGEYTELQI